MVVLCLANCPPALRGDLTRWLMEIDTGVYAGNVSARVREELWNRVSYTINIQHLLSLVKLLNPRRIHRNVRL